MAENGAPISKFVAVDVTTEPELGDAPELTSTSSAGAERAGVMPTSMCGDMAIPLGTARRSYDAIGSALPAEFVVAPTLAPVERRGLRCPPR